MELGEGFAGEQGGVLRMSAMMVSGSPRWRGLAGGGRSQARANRLLAIPGRSWKKHETLVWCPIGFPLTWKTDIPVRCFPARGLRVSRNKRTSKAGNRSFSLMCANFWESVLCDSPGTLGCVGNGGIFLRLGLKSRPSVKNQAHVIFWFSRLLILKVESYQVLPLIQPCGRLLAIRPDGWLPIR